MKELSIEEKAKAYDEALSVAQETYTTQPMYRDWLAKMFPELKESEDEKIRNALIRFHKSTIDVDGIKGENIIAWLEKQGEQMSDPRYSILNKLIEADDIYQMSVNDTMVEEAKNKAIETLSKLEISKLLGLEKQGEQNHANSTKTCEDEQKTTDKVEPKFKVGDTIKCKYDDRQFTIKSVDLDKGTYTYTQEGCGNDIDYADENFELVEQNPADKVKPKFHEGEWVIFNEHHNSVYQVEKIQGLRYYLRHYLGGTLSIRFDSELIRKWTIQDAKDGDVLVDKDNNIGIYKEIEGIYWDSYIYLGCDGKLYDFRVGGMHDQTQTHPATKGQRDNLLKAMAKAGWDFDFEKKELKKIKPIDEYEGLTDFERAVADACIGFIGKELGWKQYVKDNADNLLKIAVKKFNAVQPQPEWSVEDEDMLDNIIDDYDDADEHNLVDDIGKVMWLKALKDRVACEANCTTTKEWSEDEESIINKAESWLDTLCDYLKDSSPEYISDIKDVINKLKSLKDRYTWKPSEEQINNK